MSEVHNTVHLKPKIALLHKYLKDKQKKFCLLQYFLNVAQNFPIILWVFCVFKQISEYSSYCVAIVASLSCMIMQTFIV